MLAPFERFVDDWTAQWSRHGLRGESVEDIGRDYIERLYGFFNDNRELVEALLGARAHLESAATRLDTLFVRLEKTAREGLAEYGLPSRDPVITVRLTFGLVLSAAVHSEILFPTGHPSPDIDIVDELTRYMIHGIVHLP